MCLARPQVVRSKSETLALGIFTSAYRPNASLDLRIDSTRPLGEAASEPNVGRRLAHDRICAPPDFDGASRGVEMAKDSPSNGPSAPLCALRRALSCPYGIVTLGYQRRICLG